MNMKSEKKNHNIRHFGMMLVMVFLLISAFSASIIVSSYLFNKATREYREEIINKSARLAADMIDADRIDQWLEIGVDEEYINTAKPLKDGTLGEKRISRDWIVTFRSEERVIGYSFRPKIWASGLKAFQQYKIVRRNCI